MSQLSFLIADHNIPFIAALGLALALALVQIVAGFGDNDAEVDADADVDTDFDSDADLDADVSADPDADVDAHHVHHEVAAAGPLAALGIGRVPLMLVLMAFLGSFGAAGLIFNTLVGGFFSAFPVWMLLVSLILSAVAALPLTGAISRSLARFASRNSTAISSEELVGRVGRVVSSTVSRTYGRVAVRDRFGTLHTVFAVVESDHSLPDQTEVALVSYDEAQRRFTVRPLRR